MSLPSGRTMRFKRSERIQELLLEEISKLLQKGLKDPRIGFTTLTRVDVTDNLKLARVFVSVMGTEEERKETLAGLKSARGYIRNCLGKTLHLKYIPDLDFKLDESADHVQKITKILNELHLEQDSESV